MKNIAIVCGGYSGEYQISVDSARVVQQHLDGERYRSFLIYITRKGWYHETGDGIKHSIDKNLFTLTLPDGELIRFDGVFNAIHGTPGEDGKLLGYFDMLELPYTSCSADVSALTFNKYLCNNFVRAFGINMTDSFSFTRKETIDQETLIRELGLPLFVKPAASGSSVGITKVKSMDELDNAIATAFKEDERIIIERFVPGRELACGVMRHRGQLKVFPLTEIISKKEFFDYEAKYTAGMADEITPPDNLDTEIEMDIKAVSAFLYEKFNCKGFVRVDFIVNDQGIHFLEINTVPGLSTASILPQQARAMGMTDADLFNAAVEEMFT